MTDREQSLLSYEKNAEVALKELQKAGYSFLNSSLVWHILIYELEQWDIPTEVLSYKLKSEEISQRIRTYFDNNGLPLTNITMEKSIIPDELNNDIIKAQVKFKGEKWIIHKNDKDFFPSNPHAHNLEHHYKLHLGNGKLFRKKNCVGKINNKNLLKLRSLITQKTTIKLPSYEK